MSDPDPQVTLDRLSERFATLEAGLREAQQFVGANDDGRLTAIAALRHVIDFLASFDDLKPLGEPLLKVATALLDVENGTKAAIFEPVRKPGKRKFTGKENTLKARVLLAIEAARAGGRNLEEKLYGGEEGYRVGESRDDGAYALVVRIFGKAGIDLSKRRLRSWRGQVNNGKDQKTKRRVAALIRRLQESDDWPTTRRRSEVLIKEISKLM